jgi:hypothetical protein
LKIAANKSKIFLIYLRKIKIKLFSLFVFLFPLFVRPSIGTQWNDNREEKKWDHFNLILLFFSFLDPKVNNFDNTHGCPFKNQNDILDNPIPCKLTLLVYSI